MAKRSLLFTVLVISFSVLLYVILERAQGFNQIKSSQSIIEKSKGRDLRTRFRSTIDNYLISSFLGVDLSLLNSREVPLDQGRINSIQISSVSDYLKNKTAKTQLFAVEYTNGSIGACLGIWELDGINYIQTVGLNHQPILTPLEKIINQIASIWFLDTRSAVTHKLDGAKFKINSLWHNFGVTTPYSTVTNNFTLTNLSKTPIRVDILYTSCGCTVAEAEEDKINQNESCEIKVSVDTHNKTSITQNIRLSVTNLDSEETTEFVVYLFANQSQVSSLKPLFVDFGTAQIDSAYTDRKVRLSRTEIDNFEIKKITTSGFPIEASFSESEDRNYIIDLRAKHKTNTPGEKRGILKIITSSKFNSIFTVPYVITLRSDISTIPSIASFGLVRRGEVKKRKIQFYSKNKDKFTIELSTQTQNCQVEIDNATSSIVIVPNFTDVGRYNETVKLIVRSEKLPELIIPIRCIAFVEQN